MRKFLKASAIALAAMPAIAGAVEPPCLTPAEFTSLASYSLPSVIRGTSQRCSATLPADAFLKRNGDRLASRYAERKPTAWPGAKAAFLKLSSTTRDPAADMIRTLPDTSLQPMVDAFLEGMVSQKLPTERCVVIDRLVRLLSPLPPESTAEIIAVAAGLGSQAGRAKVGAFSICPA